MHPIFTPDDILSVLKSARLFNQFNDVQLNRLIAFSSVESFPKGDAILRQGTANDKVFILLSGEVSVYTDGEFILKLRRQGDLVGEMSVITKQPASATVIADTDVELFTVSAKNIDASGESELKSTAYKLFLDILTEKLTLTTQQVRGYQATTEELIIKKLELAQSEGDLLHKEAVLQSVLGSMSDGVVVVKANGRLLHANQAFCRMVGSADVPEDFAFWPEKLGFFRPDEITRYTVAALPMIKILDGEQVDSEEIFVRNALITEGIWLQASSRLLASLDGTPINGAVVVFRDFTLKKLEEKALIRAKEQAEAAAKAKADFLAIMSHELRTPLNNILGMSDLLGATPLNPEQQDYLDALKTGGENLLSLIRNILDYSNLDSGRLKANPKPFLIDDTLKEIIERHQLQADRKGIALAAELAPDLPLRITAYERGIRQTLRNLVDNAIKFSESGAVHITVGHSPPSGGRPALLFAVADSGIGIAEKDRAALFKPFYQLDTTYSRRFGGTGIGLSVCHQYVERMGGKIWVESELNRGSVFRFSVPYEATPPDPEDKATPPPSTLVSPLDADFAARHALRILVVEDNALNQKLILKVLNKLGYDPALAANGIEAVAICRRRTFDLVLMDLQMPEMDGLQASRIITGNGRNPDRPVIIALTANVSEIVEEDCYQAGMNGYLTKPLDLKKLARTLQQWA